MSRMQEDPLQSFEILLEQLERVAVDADVPTVMEAACSALATFAPANSLSLWIVHDHRIEFLLSTADRTDACADSVIRQAAEHEVYADPRSNPDVLEGVFFSRRLADDLRCVIRLQSAEVDVRTQTVMDAGRAVCVVVTECVSRQLLAQYLHQLAAQQSLTTFITQLGSCESLPEAAGVLAHEGPCLLGTCRVSVLIRRRHRMRVVAVTGARRIEPESETLRTIEDFANAAGVVEGTAADPHGWQSVDAHDHKVDLRPLSRSGVQRIQYIPLREHSPQELQAALVVELFQDSSAPDPQLVQQFTVASIHGLRRHLRDSRGVVQRLRTPGVVLTACLAVVTVLALWPVDFEIEVTGQIVAVDRRRIFAPESGVISEVRFENEQIVDRDHVLVRMTNPDLELEEKRIQDDLDTNQARLTAVQEARLHGVPRQGQTNSPIDLSAEELQLQQKQANFSAQLALVRKQLDALEVKSPYRGMVFTRELRQDLIARPVMQGQLLMEIVGADSPWQLELSVPARLVGYLTTYLDRDRTPTVRYLIQASPDSRHQTDLQTLDQAVQIVDGEPVCLATATIHRSNSEDVASTFRALQPSDAESASGVSFRPGTTVVARIHCGRRSAGFVVFRELIEFWQQFQFAWL